MSNDSEGDAESDDGPAAEDVEVAESEAAAAAETEAETGSGTDEDAAEEGLQYGDFVRIEYVARTVDEDHLVDTTDEAVAEEEGADTDREFGPRTIVLGEEHIFGSVEDSILGSEIGDTGSAAVPAEEAFGEYDEEQVRTVSKDKIPEDDQYPGAQVRIDGEEGFVETIIGGRARVDFNHPLAGDDIEYEWEVVGTVDDRVERAEGLLEMFLDLELDVHFETDVVEEEQLVEGDDGSDAEQLDEDDEGEMGEGDDGSDAEQLDEDDEGEDEEGPTYETVEVEKEALYIDATPELTTNQQWIMGKQQIGQQLIDLLDVDRIVVQEVIEGGGLPGMMGGMGGMGGGDVDIEEALEDADIDADDLAEEL